MSEKERKRVLFSILGVGFFVALGVGLLSFSLPLLSLDAKISGAWIGTGFAAYFFARLLAGPLGGYIADKHGPRSPLLFSLACSIFVPLLYFANPTIRTLFIVQGCMGVVSGLVRPVGLAIIGSNGIQDEGGRWFRLHTLAFNSALFLGPLAGGLLYWQGTVTSVLVGVFFCSFIAFAITYVGVPASTFSLRSIKGSEQNSTDGPGLYPLLIGVFGRSFGIGLTIAFYPILLSTKVGHDGFLIGALFSVTGLTTCLALPLGPLLKRHVSIDAGLTGLLISAVGLFCIGVSTHVVQFVVGGLCVGLGAALSIPETMVLASGYSRHQGKLFGFTSIVIGLGFVLGPLVGGFLIQQTHDVGMLFVYAGLIGGTLVLPWAFRSSKFVALILSLFLLVGFSAQSNPLITDDGLYRYTEVAMGTVVNLTLDAESKKAADDSARKVFEFMRSIQRDLDYRDPQGSIGRINEGAGKYFVLPTERVYSMVRRAVQLSEETNGVFDPTIGALTTSPMYYVLDETVARSKQHLVDYRRVIFDMVHKRIRLAAEGMALDMGGIAKGAIIDASVKLLRKLNVRAGIVEAGGDFYCFGPRDWKVGIRSPRSEDVHTFLTLREKGVCGSGDYQQFVEFERDGETNLRHHIINPKGMEPADKSSGVTVIAQRAELADAMATALFIMGPDKGESFIEKKYPDVAVMWFTPEMRVVMTDNFPKE